MEVVRLGGLYDEETKIHQMGSVWDKNALSPTIDTAQGGYRQPMIVEVKQIGNFMSTAKRENPNPGRVYDENGLSPTLTNMQGGYRQPMIIENVKQLGFMDNGTGQHQSNTVYDPNAVCPNITTVNGGGTQQIKTIVAINTESDGTARTIKSQYYKNGVANLANDNAKGGKYACTGVIVAMRGRNPENPSDRTPGAPTEQRLEPNSQGICNTLTSVQKDNLVLERYRIRKLTPKECWRLMGFTDEDFHKAEAVNSNTQLYKQAGNSIVVPVLEAIFRQMGGEQKC